MRACYIGRGGGNRTHTVASEAPVLETGVLTTTLLPNIDFLHNNYNEIFLRNQLKSIIRKPIFPCVIMLMWNTILISPAFSKLLIFFHIICCKRICQFITQFALMPFAFSHFCIEKIARSEVI